MKKNIPNFFTLCNLLCGCIAIVFAFEGDLVWCAYMVGIACVFDFSDGLIARALKVNSEIGKQLDSLADMVSFGVVPGMIVYRLLAEMSNAPGYISSIAFLIPVFSAIRLAKFNIDTKQSDSFIGLPTPANAIFFASFPIILQFSSIGESIKQLMLQPYFLISLTLVSSFLLIAPLPFFALKFKNFLWKDNKMRYLFLALSAMLLVVFQFTGIPLIIVLYILLSIINNIASKKTEPY